VRVAGAVTLVEGTSFCVSAASGDLTGGSDGVFVRDTRVLSRFDLRVDGEPPEPLAALTPDPYRATFLGRCSGGAAAGLLVQRERRVGEGLREDLLLRNPAGQPVTCTVAVTAEADLAVQFQVRAGRPRERGVRAARAGAGRLVLERGEHAVVLEAPGAELVADGDAGTLRWRAEVPARGSWTATVLVRPVVDGAPLPTPFPPDRPPEDSAPALRLRRWREATPRLATGAEGLRRVLRRSAEDLGALRIPDPEDPSRTAVAAGAPWYMALFGRDALLTSWLALPLSPDLALGTLRQLARRQGTREDPRTEEQPGRILHEARAGADFPLTAGAGGTYYGTADATPLFVVLLGELHRWGALGAEDLAELLPHADRALAWVEQHGDRDGDGFVEYARASPTGLLQQGWKDSPDGITAADGTVPDGPIALCEVQGYVFAAYRARAELAAATGDDATAARCTERAERLRARFEEAYWLPDRSWYAVALDGAKRPVDALTSNAGHCLWSGIAAPEHAAELAGHLLSPGMLSGWGVRTLDTGMGAYNPLSYHNGSVWPHDAALVAAGLLRYGFADGARRIAADLLDAAEALDGRLPELYGGFDRADSPVPVPYPTSCSPQAWASAAPVTALRVLLGLDPDLPRRRVRLAPGLPARYAPLRLEGLRLGGTAVTLTAEGTAGSIDGLPDGVAVEPAP
jgi:glycogen debranching enzyme